jgi:MFS family permease
LQAAVRLLPFIFLTVFGSIFGGGMISQLGYYSPFYIFGTALALIGAALLHTMGQFTSTSAIYGYSVLVGLGAGLYSQQGFAVAQVKVAPEQVGQALGFLATGQLVGVVVTLSIAGTVLVNTATTGLLALFPDVPVATLKNAIAGTAGDFLTSLSPQLKTEALDVIVQSMDKVWILTITAAAVGFVCSVFLKFEKVNIKPGAAV